MPYTIQGRRYLTSNEVAERLGLHRGTMCNRRSEGRDPIPFTRVGRWVLYRESDVAAYVRGRHA